MKIEVKRNILENNDRAAAANRQKLAAGGVTLLNLMASPGAGKTSAIMRAIEGTRNELSLAVIEGDIASEIDSLAIEAVGIPAIQINTGGSCHLTASMVGTALDHLDLQQLDLIIIENVGNLVCPAEFDLGEDARVVIASVAEGDDKPHKYPQIFQAADAVLLNKVDLLDHCDFDLEQFIDIVGRLNPRAAVLKMSSRTGTGAGGWCSWLLKAAAGHKRRRQATGTSDSLRGPQLENPGPA